MLLLINNLKISAKAPYSGKVSLTFVLSTMVYLKNLLNYEDVPAKPPPVVATEPSYYGGHGEVYLYLSILIHAAYIYIEIILIYTDRYMYTNYTRSTVARLAAILRKHPHIHHSPALLIIMFR